ncbi:MAG TPA: response regulator transcription factor [Paenalcaligenes sp.]|nr:response regulator transcription factor [Paenalcaligenes sp.]
MTEKHVVYILSKDPHLIRHLEGIKDAQFVTKAVNSLQDLTAAARQQLVIVDVDCIHWGAREWERFFQDHLVLVASLKPSDSEGQRAFVMGAKAYNHAYSSAEQWRRVLEHVLDGQVWLGASLLSRLLNQISTVVPTETTDWQKNLTPREIDVAQRAARGFSNQQIAQDLDISERTVRAHLGSVFAKLQVQDRLSLALLIHGLLE